MIQRVIYTAAIDTATSGDNVLVAGAPGLLIKVVGYAIVADAAVAVRWRTSTTQPPGQVNLSGAMSFAANGGISAWGAKEVPVLTVPMGADLVLNLSSAVGVRGHFAYYQAQP